MHVRTTCLALVLALVAVGCGGANHSKQAPQTAGLTSPQSAADAPPLRADSKPHQKLPRGTERPSSDTGARPQMTGSGSEAAAARPVADIGPAPAPGLQPVNVHRAPAVRSQPSRPIEVGKHNRHGKLLPIINPNNRPRAGRPAEVPSTGGTSQQSAAARASVARTAAAVRAAIPLAGTNPDPPSSPHQLLRAPIASPVVATQRFYKAASSGHSDRACGMLTDAARSHRALEALLDATLASKRCAAATSHGRAVSTPVLELRSATRRRAVVTASFATRSTQIVLVRRGSWRIAEASRLD
jgi:hypothetical protein